MIEVRNVTKTFDGFKALNDLTLTVPKGSVYGLVGPNGAGKSTLIRHLSGAYRQDEGEVLINGTPVYENTEIKSKIAYIPDDLFFFQGSNVLDLKRMYMGVYPSYNHELFEKLSRLFNIDPKKPIRRLSKGMQKQAFFWVSLCTNPDVVVLDEPVDGLDPVMRRGVWQALMDIIAEQNITVLVSSHNLRELEDVCDHVGMMHRGKMLLERNLSELQDGIVKVQIAFENDAPPLPAEFQVLHDSSIGRVKTLIVRGNASEITAKLKELNPILLDAIPLTLEEIFIYELGGDYYEKISG